jgi:thiol-disulfide isomerase/thioredoxin
MNYYFLLLFTITLTTCSAQKETNAAKNKRGDLVGFANKESFNQAPYDIWFTENFDMYEPDKAVISSLETALKDIKIKGFMGTWCEDSQRETPNFYKILELANFNFKNLELVTVNRSKKTPNNLQNGFNIEKVPTFIFYKNGEEIGRYVEYARETLEEDVLKIVSGKAYKHSYDNSK